jgi:hypothetical protein
VYLFELHNQPYVGKPGISIRFTIRVDQRRTERMPRRELVRERQRLVDYGLAHEWKWLRICDGLLDAEHIEFFAFWNGYHRQQLILGNPSGYDAPDLLELHNQPNLGESELGFRLTIRLDHRRTERMPRRKLVGGRQRLVAYGFPHKRKRFRICDGFVDAEHVVILTIGEYDDCRQYVLGCAVRYDASDLFELHNQPHVSESELGLRLAIDLDHRRTKRMPRRKLDRGRQRLMADGFAVKRKWVRLYNRLLESEPAGVIAIG